MKILIVEDDKHLNNAICDMLGKIAETEAIYDGEDAMYAVLVNLFQICFGALVHPVPHSDQSSPTNSYLTVIVSDGADVLVTLPT